MINYFLVLLLCTHIFSDAYRIFVVFPIPGKSHSRLGNSLVKTLLEDGHHITYATVYPIEEHSNLTVVDLSANMAVKLKSIYNSTVERLMRNEAGLHMNSIFEMMSLYARNGLLNQNMQHFLKNTNATFDVIIAEWMFSEIYSGLGPLLNCPLIWYTSTSPDWINLQLLESQTEPSVTGYFFSKVVPPFFLSERLNDLIFWIEILYYKNIVSKYKDKKSYDSIYDSIAKLRGTKFIPYNVARYNASLMLGNSHVSYSQAMVLPENYKAIGGHHVRYNLDPLTENLKNIMDNSNNGVIFFSAGTNFKFQNIPEKVTRSILNAFGRLNQTVLWNFGEDLRDVPKNVHLISGWVPQTGVLSHPNCVLFITHGGVLSIIEAVHFGVPIIGMPIFGDQFSNIDQAIKKGYAVKVDWSVNVDDKLIESIEEVLNNPMYKEKMKEFNWIYHSRLVTPETALVFWVKHVVETRGAPHLRSAALMVSWYQRMYLDWVALIFIIILSLYKIACFLNYKIYVTIQKPNKKLD